jgi:trans-2-enoyl-CoA reductase
MRELRREAQRRIDERYAALDGENERLRQQLADYVAYQRDIDRMLIEPPEELDFGPDSGVPVRPSTDH